MTRNLLLSVTATLGLLIGSTACAPSGVDKHWGEAYREDVYRMVADPELESRHASEPAPEGTDGATAAGIMGDYRASQAPAPGPSLPLPMIVTPSSSLGSR